MDCSYYRTLGSLIIDEQADESQIAEFNEHIASCPDCARWFEALKILHSEIPETAETAPEELRARVMNSVSMMKKNKPSIFSRFKFTAAAAVVVLIVFAANGFTANQQANNHTPQVASETPASGGRAAPAPDEDTATSTYTSDYEFSYVISISEGGIPSILETAPYEIKDGCRHYISNLEYDAFKDVPHQLISHNPELSTNGLIIIQE